MHSQHLSIMQQIEAFYSQMEQDSISKYTQLILNVKEQANHKVNHYKQKLEIYRRKSD